ncbi:TIGR03752 family integrating conjugative element protein [Vibrio sp. S11_S32]|uniref:TIGR03752 family integrating conjugative element protein n=1 Tax=Vibrio sp. S11_S32 TaxID=2720225 RepID=UPI001680DA1E|nr:TIGR03752 family integrating conjugative element protein [Vibrio sp. S11_S32]MBD1577106.1 TIGR03752 family integrating conjugative element protein [Vibrio sp. S11_S32]
MNNPMKAIIAILIVVIAFAFMKHGDNPKPVHTTIVGPASPTGSSEELTTDNEKLSTLVALVRKQNEELEKTKREINDVKQQQKEEKSDKLEKSDQISDQVINKLKKTGQLGISDKVESELLGIKDRLKDFTGQRRDEDNNLEDDDFGIKDSTPSNIYVGGGELSKDNSKPSLIKPNGSGSTDTSQPQKIVYETAKPKVMGGWTLGDDVTANAKTGEITTALSKADIEENNFGTSESRRKKLAKKVWDSKDKDPTTPYGTINQEATLTDATTMTALLARIPVGGALTDPYEFKVLVGRTNLAANGLYIPNLDRIVMRGVAKGDYTGQCASGDIVAATFIFQDGRIQTINAQDKEQGQSSGDGSSDYDTAGTVTKDRLGWISTRGGVPCLSGEYISDAPKFIAMQGGLAALGALAEGYSSASQTNMGTGDNRESVINNSSQYAAGQAGAAATQTATDWLNEIKESAFGLVYLPTNQNVDIHITKEMRIDYHHKGRLLTYNNNVGNGNEQSNLD